MYRKLTLISDLPDSAIFCTFDISSAGEAVFCILLHDTVSKHAAIIIVNCFILDKNS